MAPKICISWYSHRGVLSFAQVWPGLRDSLLGNRSSRAGGSVLGGDSHTLILPVREASCLWGGPGQGRGRPLPADSRRTAQLSYAQAPNPQKL